MVGSKVSSKISVIGSMLSKVDKLGGGVVLTFLKAKKLLCWKVFSCKGYNANIDTCNAIPNGWMGLDIGPEIYK